MDQKLLLDVQQFLEQAEQTGGFYIKNVPLGTMLEVDTQSGSTYTLVITSPDQHELVMVGPHKRMRQPSLYYLQGATRGGSSVEVGWLRRGLCLRLNGAGSLVTTSPVQNFRVINDPDRVLHLVAEAESHRLQKPSDKDIDRFNQSIDQMISEFPPEYRDRASEFIYRFNPQGRAMMVQIMRLANDRGRLTQALDLLDRQYKKHWAYRAPEIRGSFITEIDVEYIEAAYNQLRLPLPNQSD
ncbi:hypothetical protein KKF05_02500 [Patescibacteria group bacterium]|nr:hypothetical protein [Patescibacteria group bacterium]MBU1029416.1 hypothetical protein [Patescibacteria group bacterium]MBU1915720.1 hypothetical protein [Patescibacteria group bacterium]